MKKEKKTDETQKNRVWQIAIAAIYGLSFVAFFVSLILLGMLPAMYLALFGVVGIGVSALLLKGLFSKKEGKRQLLCGIIIAILSLGLIAATSMIGGALSFFKNVAGGNVQTYDYYVVTRNDGTYKDVNDIEGEQVHVLEMSGQTYETAQKMLAEKVNVTFQSDQKLETLTEGLIQKKSNVIFLSSSHYEMAVEESEKFTKKNTQILHTIRVEVQHEKKTVNKDLTKDAFNVYISGIDTTGSITNASRSDVNMIMTVNPTDRKILLTSIPRDYHVVLSSYGAYDKLTHSGIYGIDETIETVEDLMGIDIDHYVKVNFTTVTKLVDALGGITVDSDYAFTSRDGFSYVEGENYLNGEQALSFARERKAFAAGDNQRVKNQQAVISGILNKATSSTAILTQYSSILGALSENMEISLSQKEMSSLIKMQLADMRGWDIDSTSLKGSGSSAQVYSMPGVYVYVMEPNQESIDKAKAKIDEIMSGKTAE